MNHVYFRVFCSGCGNSFDVADYCGNRFCGICTGQRNRRIRAKMEHLLRSTPSRPGYRWRFVTLTEPSTADVSEGLISISSAFRKLRQHLWYKRRVLGGFSVFELTHGSAGWHIHIHALLFSRFLPVRTLCSHWQRASSGKIVDVRLVPHRTAVGYLTKYLTKTALAEAEQKTASESLKGRRLFSTFGSISKLLSAFHPPHALCRHCSNSEWIHERSRYYHALVAEFEHNGRIIGRWDQPP